MATIEKYCPAGLFDPSGYSQGIKVTVTDMRNRPHFRTVRDEFFGVKGPASTLIEVSALADPDYLIEIEAIAVV